MATKFQVTPARLAFVIVATITWVLFGNYVNTPSIIKADIQPQEMAENTVTDNHPINKLDLKPVADTASLTIISKKNASENSQILLDKEAISSLRDARLNGDPRSPPIAHTQLTQRANGQQKSDPDQYNHYQDNKKKQLIINYMQAIQPKIETLKEQVKKAKEKGLPAEQLAEGEEKIKKMQDMLEKLAQQYPTALSQNSQRASSN